jgi:hypothetical protein
MNENKNGSTAAPAGIDLDSPLIAALKSARELLANLDGLSKNNICNLAAEEVEQIDAALARRAAEAAPAAPIDALKVAVEALTFYADPKNNCPGAAAREALEKIAQQSSHSTAAVVATDERALFEAWYAPKFGQPKMLGDSDQYQMPSAQGAWQAWQARAALASHAGLSQFANGEDAGQPAQPSVDQIADVISRLIGAVVLDYFGGRIDENDEPFRSDEHEREYLCDMIRMHGGLSAASPAAALDAAHAQQAAAPTQPFGMYVERDDGTTEFQRTGKAFQPTACGYKVWTLYAAPPLSSGQQAGLVLVPREILQRASYWDKDDAAAVREAMSVSEPQAEKGEGA